jgi:hypothetical protein
MILKSRVLNWIAGKPPERRFSPFAVEQCRAKTREHTMLTSAARVVSGRRIRHRDLGVGKATGCQERLARGVCRRLLVLVAFLLLIPVLVLAELAPTATPTPTPRPPVSTDAAKPVPVLVEGGENTEPGPLQEMGVTGGDQGAALPEATGSGGANRVDVCGLIDADTTWTSANLYVITCEVTVAKGATLTVMPGTIVKAYPGGYTPCAITVFGRLVAEGTVEAPIVFTSIKDDEHGGDTENDGSATAPGPGDWQSINLEAGSSGSISNALIAYGGWWYWYDNLALVRCNEADIKLDRVTLRVSSQAALSARRCSVELTNSRLADNRSGLDIVGLAADAPFTLTNNVFGPSAAGTMHFDGNPHGPVSIHDNVAVDGKTGLSLRGTLEADLDWHNDELVLLLVTGLTVAPEATLLLAPGSVVKSDLFSGSAIEVNGTLLAEGTPVAPIVFSSIRDDEHGGDTNADGSNTTIGPGQWSGVTVNAGGRARIAHAEMLYGGNYYYFSYANALVRAVGGEVSLDDVTLRGSNWNAIYADNGAVRVRGSRMEDNWWNVRNDTPTVGVDARYNWWGDPSGPHHPTLNPDGMGKDVTDGVWFEPWLDRFTWVKPTTMFLHGVEELSWAAFDVDPAGLTADLKATGAAGTQILGEGVSPSGELEWDTRPLAGGRYELRAKWLDVSATLVSEAMRSVVVNNDPAIEWHSGRLLASETWGAEPVHVVEDDVIVGAGVRLTIEPGAIVKFAFGTRIVVEEGGILDAPATEAATIILTSVSDDTRGDTNLDGTQSLPRPGDWKSVVTQGSGQFNRNRFVDIRYSLVAHSGLLSADETWMGALVHHVTGDVTVPNGVTLTIEPGAVVKFDAYKGLILQPGGHLIALGAAAQPIVFTSSVDDTAGGDTNGDGAQTTPQAGNWRWIYVDGAEAIFDHVEMRYGGGTESGSWEGTGVIRTTPGATVTISNSVIRDGFYECILASGSGTVTITSSVIAGCDRGVNSDYAAVVRIINSTIDDNRIGIWGHAGRLDLSNTIVSNSLEAGIDNVLSSPLTIGHSDVWSEQGANYVRMDDQTGVNGNISADPRYKDRERGNYRLNYVSRAIDAADGSVAPDADAAGAPRYDDPRTANTGTPTSTGAFADMGAYEFVETAESDLDLVVTSVIGPTEVRPGDKATIEWTITNVGTGVAVGPWHDAIWLVYSPDHAPTVVYVDEVAAGTGTVLGPGQSYTVRSDVTVPGSIVGPHYWQVNTNARGDVFEGQHSDDNGARSLSPVALDLPELIVDGPAVSGHVGGTGEARWFKLIAAAGQSVRVSLDIEPGADVPELLAGYGYMPTRDVYHMRGLPTDGVTVNLLVSDPPAGTQYVAVIPQRVPDSAVSFTIRAQTAAFRLLAVTPNRGGNSGTVTLAVTGEALPEDAGVRLTAAGGGQVLPRSQSRVDATRIMATFDLAGVPAGRADVVVSGPAGAVRTLAGSFLVLDGGTSDFWFEIAGPERIRAGRQASFELRWGNRGTIDAPMHLIDVVLPDNVDVALLPQTPPLTERFLLLTAVRDSPEAVIPAGHSEHRTLYVTPRLVSELTLDAGAVGINDPHLASTAIDWEAMGPTVRPEGMSDQEWDAFWTQLTIQLGNTWADMLQQLARDAAALNQTTIHNEPAAPPPGGVPVLNAFLAEIGEGMRALGWNGGQSTIAEGAAALRSVPGVPQGQRAPQPPPKGQTYALIASAQAYGRWEGGFTDEANLWSTAENHEQVYDFLTAFLQNPQAKKKPNGHYLNDGNIRQLWYGSATDPGEKFTKDNFDKHLSELAKKARYEDTIFVYIVGHGFHGELLVPDANYINYEADIYNVLSKSSAGKVVVVLEACESGSFTDWLKGHHNNRDELRKWAVFASAARSRNAYGNGTTGDTMTYQFFGDYLRRGGSWYKEYQDHPTVRTKMFWTQKPQWFGDSDDPIFGPTLSERLSPTLGKTKHGAVNGLDCLKKAPRSVQEAAVSASDCPPGSTRKTFRAPVAGSADPNEKRTVGIGERGYTTGELPITYTIYFENDPQHGATAPVQELLITDQLSERLDWSSLQLGTIGFGEARVNVPLGRESFATIESVPYDAYPIAIEAGLDRDTGVVTWHVASQDPVTQQLPEDPFAGFLPVNDESGRGQGFVTFLVKPKAGLTDSTEIPNQATITFDPTYGVNPPIVTNETLNTIGTPPTACPGDCNGDGNVTVNELIQGVNIALGTMAVTECPSFDADDNNEVTVSELIKAVNNALTGCEQPGPTAAPTPTVTHGPGGTPTRTPPF